jgi:hypothetical protein
MPGRLREFVRATGRLAKTDAIDADVLAHYCCRICKRADFGLCSPGVVSCWE